VVAYATTFNPSTHAPVEVCNKKFTFRRNADLNARRTRGSFAKNKIEFNRLEFERKLLRCQKGIPNDPSTQIRTGDLPGTAPETDF
jgi:hypothetical protein